MFDLSIIVEWLDSLFGNFDYFILKALHDFAVATNGKLNSFFRFISIFGDSGIALLILSALLIIIRKTRRIGICMLFSICIGAIFTNLILKKLIARPRLFSDIMSEYYTWWQYAGATMETSYSFPSGHVTAAMSSMTGLFLSIDKHNKKRWLCFIFVFLMALSRNYLMVHYPSDVIAAMIVGGTSGALANMIVKKLYTNILKRE